MKLSNLLKIPYVNLPRIVNLEIYPCLICTNKITYGLPEDVERLIPHPKQKSLNKKEIVLWDRKVGMNPMKKSVRKL